MSTATMPANQVEDVDPGALPIFSEPVDVPAPRVNLLPPEITEQRAVRRLAAALAAVVVVCGVAVGGGYVQAGKGEAAARSDLTNARSMKTSLERQQQSLLPAQQAQTQVLAAQKALASAMGNDVLWSRYLDQLRVQRPEGVRFSSVALTPTNGTGATAAAGSTAPTSPSTGSTGGGATVAAPGGIATLTISGKARSQLDVATLLQQLALIRGFTGVYLTSTTGDGSTGVISYTVTAGVTAEALSHRYTAEGQ